jgi:prophage regulatory protein
MRRDGDYFSVARRGPPSQSGTEHLEQQMNTPTPPRKVLRLPDVQNKIGIRRDSIYRSAREGWLPRPIKLTERCSGWFEDEIDQWLTERAAQRTAPNSSAE